jgi:DNA mismatch repair protein MutH
MYLAACTKSSDSSVRRQQPNSDIPAKPRAFSLKSSYMTYVLNNYIIPSSSKVSKVDAIVNNGHIVSFDKYVYDKIAEYRGRSIEELCNEFNIPSDTPAKNLGAVIAYRILGVKSNSAEEFVKAGIKVKTIRVNENNTITESMSFPAMSFNKIASEEWEESDFYQLLTETKFFFVVFKYDVNNTLRLLGCKFWNMPGSDLSEVESVWNKTKQLINGGLVIERINGKYTSNFPKASENSVSHVRPHARNAEDVDILPDGRVFPKQCFWLNNSYILSQIQDLL